MRGMETNYKSCLATNNLSTVMRIVMDGVTYMEYNLTDTINKFLNMKPRRYLYTSDKGTIQPE